MCSTWKNEDLGRFLIFQVLETKTHILLRGLYFQILIFTLEWKKKSFRWQVRCLFNHTPIYGMKQDTKMYDTYGTYNYLITCSM